MGDDNHGTKIGHAEHHRISRGVHNPQSGMAGHASQPSGHPVGDGARGGGSEGGTRVGFAEHHVISGSREPHCFPKGKGR